MEYKISLTFQTLEEMQTIILKQEKSLLKKDGDRRGKHMIELHKKVKNYQTQHPEIYLIVIV